MRHSTLLDRSSIRRAWQNAECGLHHLEDLVQAVREVLTAWAEVVLFENVRNETAHRTRSVLVQQQALLGQVLHGDLLMVTEAMFRRAEQHVSIGEHLPAVQPFGQVGSGYQQG